MEKFFEAQAKAAGKQDVDSDKDNGDTSGSSDSDSVDPRMANDPFCSEESEDFDQFCDGEFEFADDRCEKFAHKIGIALIPKAHRMGQFVNLREKLRKMEEERDRDRKGLLAAFEDKKKNTTAGVICGRTDYTDSTGAGSEIVAMNITEQSSATPNVAVAPLEVVAAPCLEMVDEELQVCELQALEEVPSAVTAKNEDPCSSTSGEQVVEEVVDEIEAPPEEDHDSEFEQWVADSMRNYDERDSDSTSSSSSSAAAPNQDHDSPLHDHEVIDFRGEIVVQEKSVPVIDEEDQRGETIIETRLKQLLGEADFEVYCKDMQELLDRKLLMDEMRWKTGDPPAVSEQEEEVEQDESTKLVAFVKKALKPQEIKILRQICKLEKAWNKHLRIKQGGGRTSSKPRERNCTALGGIRENAGPATLMIQDTEDSDSLLNSSSSSASSSGFDLANRTSSGDDDGNDAINYDEDFWSSDYDFGFEHQNVFEDSTFSSPAESVELPVQQEFLSVVQEEHQMPSSSASRTSATSQRATPSSLHAQKGAVPRLPVAVSNSVSCSFSACSSAREQEVVRLLHKRNKQKDGSSSSGWCKQAGAVSSSRQLHLRGSKKQKKNTSLGMIGYDQVDEEKHQAPYSLSTAIPTHVQQQFLDRYVTKLFEKTNAFCRNTCPQLQVGGPREAGAGVPRGGGSSRGGGARNTSSYSDPFFIGTTISTKNSPASDPNILPIGPAWPKWYREAYEKYSYPVQKYRTRSNRSHAYLQISLLS